MCIRDRPNITHQGLEKLGIEVADFEDSVEDIIIGFTISTDLNS